MSEPEIVMTKVRTYDGLPAYKLPNGTIITQDAWDSEGPDFLRLAIALDAERKPGN